MRNLNSHNLTGSIASGEIKLTMPKFKPLNKSNEGCGELNYIDDNFVQFMKEGLEEENNEQEEKQ